MWIVLFSMFPCSRTMSQQVVANFQPNSNLFNGKVLMGLKFFVHRVKAAFRSSSLLNIGRSDGGSVAEWLKRRTCSPVAGFVLGCLEFKSSSAELEIRRPRVQVLPWPLAGFVHGSLEFKSWATLVNSQLVCLQPVGILGHIMFHLNYWFIIPEKPYRGTG